MPKPRTIFYIDGFNFYYGSVRQTPYKWLNLEELCLKLRPDDDLRSVKYFTSRVGGSAGKRQAAFLKALSTCRRVEIIYGQFKTKKITCRHPSCTFNGSRVFSGTEEKRTDVNIAISMVDDAYRETCDHIVLVSGDSDLVPAIQLVLRRFPRLKVFVYVPGRRGVVRRADQLRQAAGNAVDVPANLVASCQFPDTILSGSTEIAKPDTW